MVTDRKSPKICSKNNWYYRASKHGFFDSLTKDNLIEIFIKFNISLAFRHVTDLNLKTRETVTESKKTNVWNQNASDISESY